MAPMFSSWANRQLTGRKVPLSLKNTQTDRQTYTYTHRQRDISVNNHNHRLLHQSQHIMDLQCMQIAHTERYRRNGVIHHWKCFQFSNRWDDTLGSSKVIGIKRFNRYRSVSWYNDPYSNYRPFPEMQKYRLIKIKYFCKPIKILQQDCYGKTMTGIRGNEKCYSWYLHIFQQINNLWLTDWRTERFPIAISCLTCWRA